MEFALGGIGLALTALVIMMTYIWRTNGRAMRILQEGQKEIVKGIEGITKGIEGIAQITKEVHEGQREMLKLLVEINKKVS